MTLARASFPAPSAAAMSHSTRLSERIAAQIDAAGGAIGFDTYMDAALYAPGLGYYSAGSAKLGAEGDFITAPEISTLFARCLARQVEQVLSVIPGAAVAEVGAGTGRLAAVLLKELQLRPPGAEDSHAYYILERSADLRARQKRTLIQALGERFVYERVFWLDDLPAAGFRGIILANELLDALPAACFEVVQTGLVERCVIRSGDSFEFAQRAPAPGLARALASLASGWDAPRAVGYRSEVGLAARAWVREAGTRLARGALLLVDYGYPRSEYYHPQRTAGTLRCHYRHRAHEDPFLWPGLQDISVHVDFTALALAGRQAGLQVAGFTSQAGFLLSTGLLELAAEADPGSREHMAIASQIKQLTLPAEMGDAFKVLALTRGSLPPLVGFRELDFRPRLGLAGTAN